MDTRSTFAEPLDRNGVRSSHTGNAIKADSPFTEMSGMNEARPMCCGNLDAKQSQATVSTGTFLIGSALSTSGQPGREHQ
jgi:hypothetical protein